MKQYTALLVDIRNSRGYTAERRTDIQRYLRDCVDAINGIFAPSLACEVMFSGGDEMQGLFRAPGAAYLYLRLLRLAMAPVGLRAGIGVGGWETVVPGGVSTEQDGPAYHRAREAINAVHKADDRGVLLLSASGQDAVLNACLHASERLTGRRTQSQKMLLLLLECLYPLHEERVADVNGYERFLHVVWNDAGKAAFSEKKRTGELPVLHGRDKLSVAPIALEKVLESGFYCSGSFQVKGISTALSGLLGVSRQSVEKSIKSAAIYESRELDAAILRMLAQTFGG